mgnify:CR=1 FL=1
MKVKLTAEDLIKLFERRIEIIKAEKADKYLSEEFKEEKEKNIELLESLIKALSF